MTKNYHSILPSVEAEERVPLHIRSYQSSFVSDQRSERQSSRKQWYLWIPAFCFGVFGIAVVFVLQSNNDDPSFAPVAPPQAQTTFFPEMEQWDEWKESLVHAAEEFRLDVQQAWTTTSKENDQARLLQDWFSHPLEAQVWWQDISASSKAFLDKLGELTREDAAKAQEFLSGFGNETRKWAGEVGSETSDLWSHAANKTRQFADDTSHEAKHAAENTKEWTENAENTTGHWLGDEAHKSKEWIGKESKETGKWMKKEGNKTWHAMENAAENTEEWTENAANTTGHWVGKESHEAGKWISKEAKDTGKWINKEAKDTGKWIEKEGNTTWHEVEHGAEWLGDETKRGAETTEHWFAKESNVTEHWISREARAAANWFQKEAKDSENWFKKEANATGRFFKKEANATARFAQKQSNRTVHWFEADAEAVRIWWNNVTHRRSRAQDQETLEYFNTTASFALLVSGYGWYDSSRDFFAYQQGFDTQENQAYCSVASAAAVINSFRGRVELPMDPSFSPYPYATQNNLFNECTDKNVIVHNETFDGIRHAPGGLNLDQTKALLDCNLPKVEWSIEAYHVDPSNISLDEMRKDLVLALMSPASRVIVNINRAAANQVGGGHFSPLGGYSHERDSFLLMDVAKYKYPYVWIPASILYRSLMTVDSCGSLSKSPEDQVDLTFSHPELARPQSSRDLTKAMSKLGCQAAYRGYLVVKQL